MFSYKDFISAMKQGIFMDVEVRNWRLSIDNDLFVDAVDWT